MILPAFAVLCTDLFEKSGDLSSLVALRLSLAQDLMQGKELYTDFFEWTQPFVFEWGKLVYLMQGWLGSLAALRIETISKICFAFALLLSSFLSLIIICQGRPQVRASTDDAQPADNLEFDLVGLAFIASLFIFSLFMRLQLGELQWYLSLAIAPWILLRSYRYSKDNFNCPLILSFFIGILNGFAAILDLPYLVIYFLLETYFLFTFGKFKRNFKSVEMAGFCSGILSTIAHFFCLPTAVRQGYIEWAVPFKLLSWQTFDETLYGPATSPDQTNIYYLAGLAVLAAVWFGRRNAVMIPMALIVLCGSSLNLLEKQGFTRDLILLTYGALSILLMAATSATTASIEFLLAKGQKLSALLRRTIHFSGYALFVLILSGSSIYLSKRSDKAFGESLTPHPKKVLKGTLDINVAVSQNSQWKDPVIVMCDYPDASYPLLFNLERPNAGYFLTGRPVRLFAALRKLNTLKDNYLDLYDHGRDVLQHRFQTARAKLILLHGAYQLDFINETELRPTLEDKYAREQDVSFYSDNIEPREYLGSDYAFEQYLRRSGEQR
ncbi:MAG TPA: hypothetical protein PLI59_01635 [Candidatus Obscuribacter sp.]|nr:hypothetical protein [Candidatus Obscuribacter sp.]